MSELPVDTHQIPQVELPESLALLPVKDLVLFPFMIVPLLVAREVSAAAVDQALGATKDRLIFVTVQRAEDESPQPETLNTVGTVATIVRMRKLSDGRMKILLQGLFRARVVAWLGTEPCFTVTVEQLPDLGGHAGHGEGRDNRSGAAVDREGRSGAAVGDQTLDLAQPAGALAEDALPLLLRTYPGRPDLLPPGGERGAPLLLSLARARLRHLPLRYARATLRRAAAPAPYTTPAGTFPAITYTIDIGDIGDGPTGTDQLTYHIEAAPPHRVLGWSARSGEEARLRGTARLPYWQLNRPGGEAALQQLGLVPIAR